MRVLSPIRCRADGDGRFAIDATSGALTNAVVLDYESLASEERVNGIALVVAASDEDGNTATAAITVTITDMDEAPTFSSSSYSFTQVEATAAGEVVGVVSATLTGAGSVTYSLPADGDGRFAIDATSGALTNAIVLDYESLASGEQATGIALVAEASDGDGNTATAAITVTITDVDEAPTFSSSSYSFTQLENTDAGEVVGVVSATLTGAGSVTYSLPADGDGRFAIDATSGALTNAVVLDYEILVPEEQANGIALMVVASDGDGNTATATITVTITDVDEAPTFSSSSYSFTQLENTDVGEVIGVVSATLTGAGSVTYSLSGGWCRQVRDRRYFWCTLTNAVVLDYESLAPEEQANGIALVVAASDGDGNTATAAITVTITDVDEVVVPQVRGVPMLWMLLCVCIRILLRARYAL